MGSSVAVDSVINLPSGSLSVHANGNQPDADVTIGGDAVLNVGGTSKAFNDVTEYTSAGQVAILSDQGSVTIADGGKLNLAAQAGGGSGGILSIGAPDGFLSLGSGAHVAGAGGSGGLNGSFLLDVASIPGTVSGTSTLGGLGASLSTGGFTQDVSIRVRNGDVAVDGTIKAHQVNLSADSGSVTVDATGTIDASGATGGAIDIAASGSVTLDSGATLTAKGLDFDSAGHGGSVALEAGSNAGAGPAPSILGSGPQLSLLSGSTVDVSVTNNLPLQLNASGSSSITVPVGVSVSFPTGTPGDDEVTFGVSGTITNSLGVSTPFAAGYSTAVAPGSIVVLSGSGAATGGTINFAPGGTGGSIPLNVPRSVSTNAAFAESNVTDLSGFNETGTLMLRAPQAVDASGNPVDVQISPLNGTVLGASSIVAQGYAVFTPAGGVVDTIEASVKDNGARFAGGMDSTGTVQTGNTAAIEARLLGSNSGLSTVFHVQPGAEIVNAANPSSPTSVALNGGGSSIALPANTAVEFPSGGAQMTFSVAGTVSGSAGTITKPIRDHHELLGGRQPRLRGREHGLARRSWFGDPGILRFTHPRNGRWSDPRHTPRGSVVRPRRRKLGNVELGRNDAPEPDDVGLVGQLGGHRRGRARRLPERDPGNRQAEVHPGGNCGRPEWHADLVCGKRL